MPQLIPYPPIHWKPKEDVHLLPIGFDRAEMGRVGCASHKPAESGPFPLRYCEAHQIDLARLIARKARDGTFEGGIAIFKWSPSEQVYILVEEVA